MNRRRGRAGPRGRGLASTLLGIAALATAACRSPAADDGGGATTTTTTTGATTGDPSSGGESSDGSTTEAPADPQMVHSFGKFELKPNQETFPCVQWTPHLEQPLYVNTVLLANDGGAHHSNWFVLPEAAIEGEDGTFDCEERGFDDFVGAINGAVLFAQSTQSRYEAQELPPGVVIKIPPHYKVMAQIHMLNSSTLPLTTEVRMGFELIHPAEVAVIAAPFRLSYEDLRIPAHARSRHTAECDLGKSYEGLSGAALDIKLLYALPHYHYLGERFTLEIAGGPRDGEPIFELDGFNGDGNGRTFDPPIDLSGADGLRFSCQFNNWTDQEKHYGNGDQEMCMMLGLADSKAMLDATVSSGSKAIGVDGEVQLMAGPCAVIALPKPSAYAMPTDAEIAGPLYVPPPGPGDGGLPPVKPCVDADPAAAPAIEATLSNLRATIFAPSCTFSACHFQGPAGAAAGLDLSGPDLHAALLGHPPPAAAGMPLVTPGDPAQSWIYRLVSECEPRDQGGSIVAHMPLNAPTLLEPGLVAALRAWIAGGALDN